MTQKEWLVLGVFGLIVISGGAAAIDATTGDGGVIQRIANAIAHAEGFNVPGSLPARNNNPGDISHGGMVDIYATVGEGWAALIAQVTAMFDGSSGYYNPAMTIAQVAAIYAEDSGNWANNVAGYLGVSVNTRLSDL